MTIRYHVNKEGVPAICKAKKGNCPFGGEHFDTIEETQKYADTIHKQNHGLLPDANQEETKFSNETIKKAFPNLNTKEIKLIRDYAELEIKTYETVEELKNTSHSYKGTDEYIDRVNEVRQLALEKYTSHQEASKIANKESLDEFISSYLPEKKPWITDPNYQFHPEITDKNFNYGIGKVMSAYSGKTNAKIRMEIERLRGDGEDKLSLHEATKVYWDTLEQRTDKPIISIDLETANPRDKSLDYDNGQLTYIIEVGAIKTYPDGRIEKIDFQSGIPAEFAKSHGTGFEETHNISVQDIEGKAEFSADDKTQKEMLDFLDNSVLIAHNAYFEERQFTNSLRGFKNKLNEGSIEMLDTMNFCKFLVPESARNTNEAFVEAAGLEYKNAHRAYSDAEMTLNAFNILKENR